MRQAIGSAAGLAIAALATGTALSIAIAVLNPAFGLRDFAAVSLDLSLATAILIAVPVFACAAVGTLINRGFTTDRIVLFAGLTLFVLLWFARLEPAHQMVSVSPHLTGLGMLELAIITVVALAALVIISSDQAFAARVVRTLLLLVISSVVLWIVALAVEPSRRRDAELQSIAARFPARTGHTAGSGRVLMIGIDGLDWRTVGWMSAHGRMPALQRLLSSGRFYQHDNRRMGYSAVIWTSIFNGHTAVENGIGGFAKWQFGGARRPIGVFPAFGMHAIFFFDEFLRRVQVSQCWRDVAVTTADSPYPPVWAIASQRGKRVGVYDPVPHEAIPERLNGFFVVNDDLGHELFRQASDGRDVIVASQASTAVEFAADRENAEVAANLFQREHPDFGVFYTHVVDTVQHEDWLKTRLDDGFAATRIARAYDLADAMIETLSKGFGSDATIVVVSDHGWEYSDYEHFTSPFGVLAIAPLGVTGYGGAADVLAIAPTVLALLDVPADSSMSDPIPPLVGRRTSERYADTIERTYLIDHLPDEERRQRLRSLGYVEGRPTR